MLNIHFKNWWNRISLFSKPAFLKLWSADHLWSSKFALVILQKVQKKNSNSNELRITL